MLNTVIKFNILLFFIFITQACNDNNKIVPNVYVNFYLSVYDPEFTDLLSPGNSIYVTGGVNGILIYRISQDEFAAYDRTCTYNVEENCRIVVDDTKNFAIDSMCCSSKFLLLDGSVTDGPATYPLKRYQTYFDGTNLHVYN